ncbi:MAG: phosphoenolpyruvate carboxykinase (ATP), partial [Clostridia bacterium]|nr:phosphoenolpyruvate carboxykinase (ATP) [Clostridia bacterium]
MSLESCINNILQRSEVKSNLSIPALMEAAIRRGEGILTNKGSLRVTTGKYTGRSPDDKFFVRDKMSENVINWCNINRPMSPQNYQLLFEDITNYLMNQEVFVFDGYAGADSHHRLKLRIINDQAWQNMFCHQLFIRPTAEELVDFFPDYHIIAAPGFKANPQKHGTNSEAAIVVNLTEKTILIAGASYAGEIKKSVFSLVNYVLPIKNVLSMHCSANVDSAGNSALFFGLSGTGKTTLSADPKRQLIGDDEHGWSNAGIFNIEGGCYAKSIGLSALDEPQIYGAIRFGTVLENVSINKNTREVDFSNGDITENTRAAYPLNYIPNALIPSIAGHPKVIFFLTADAFGVLPPIASLNIEQAMYHFLSGYTSKLAGTERGIKEPQATFSECFGSPFLPLPPIKYANLLGEKIRNIIKNHSQTNPKFAKKNHERNEKLNEIQLGKWYAGL